MEQARRPDLVYVVDNLDAPWKVSSDADGEQFLVVRNGTPFTVPLANVINDLAAQRTMIGRLRKQMDNWDAECTSTVPQQPSHAALPPPHIGERASAERRRSK